MDWMNLLQVVGPLLLGGGIGWATKAGRAKDKADAFKKMEEAFQMRINDLHETIKVCNNTIKELQDRIAELNHALNDKQSELQASQEEVYDKKLQIRNLTAQALEAQQEANRINDKLFQIQQFVAEKEREIADLRVALEDTIEWRCEHTDCQDPRGRRPPNERLCGKIFKMPSILQKYQPKNNTPIKLTTAVT